MFSASGTFHEFAKNEIEQTIPQRFQKIVRQFPERTAVESRRRRLTYRELHQVADNTAHAVLQTCGNRSGSIAVLMEHDALVIAAILGALKAGKCYVPPPARSKFILEDVQSESIITNTRYLQLARTLVGLPRRVVNIDEIENLADCPPPMRSVQLDDLCSIIYTSAQPESPKGSCRRTATFFIS